MQNTKVGDTIRITKTSPESKKFFDVGDIGKIVKHNTQSGSFAVNFKLSKTVKGEGYWAINSNPEYFLAFAEWEIIRPFTEWEAMAKKENEKTWRKDSIFCNCSVCYDLHHKAKS